MNTYDRNIKAIRCLACVIFLTIAYGVWAAGRVQAVLADKLTPMFERHATEIRENL